MSKKGRNTNKRLSIGALIGLCSVGAVVLWAVVAVIVGLLSQGKDFALFAALALGLSDYRVWVIFLCSVVGIAVMLAAREMRSGRRVLKVNDIEDSRWLAHADIAKSDNMAITSYSKLGDVATAYPCMPGVKAKT